MLSIMSGTHTIIVTYIKLNPSNADLLRILEHSVTRHTPERLDILHVESLELRRLKLDLTMMFPTIHGYCALDSSSFFAPHNSSMHGICNKFKLMKQFRRVNCCIFSFANRCIDHETVSVMMLFMYLLCQFLNIILNVFDE